MVARLPPTQPVYCRRYFFASQVTGAERVVPTPLDAATTMLYEAPIVRPESVVFVAETVCIVAYGPPFADTWTAYDVAPMLAVHATSTAPLVAVDVAAVAAVTTGVDGGRLT